ncbi:MAG TPA: aspartate kinase [Planctomycetes bacterium]|nr:aspartate kinase [Planctomycetota bacterium]
MNPPDLGKPIWVMKFGGTSVASPELILNAVKRIRQRREQGYHVVTVVSAMGDTTDRLLKLASKLSQRPSRRELDVLLSAGEVQSMALLSISLEDAGLPAISFTGQQGGIRTDGHYSEAKILEIDPARIVNELKQERVVVVAGFQGVDHRDDITTLGRGGSDTSAVALAAVLGASNCEILTDVDGVFTADPRLVPNARLIESVSYDEMLEMASLGASVLHGRSVEVARRFKVPLSVASSTGEGPGTRIGMQGDEMEKVIVRAITDDRAVRKISILGVPDKPGVAAHVFRVLGDQGVNVRLIVQAQSHDGHNDITFVVPSDAPLEDSDLQNVVNTVGGKSWLMDDKVALLNVVGEGITREPGIAGKIFSVLAEEGVNIEAISSSNLVITCVVAEESLEKGARALHAALIETD